MKHAQTQHRPKRYGMVIDLDKCTGCGACMVACFSENNVSFRADESDKRLSITWMKVYKVTNGESFPDTEVCYFPRPCQHCAGQHEGHSPCVSVCPATATDYSRETGIVSQIYTRCVSDAATAWGLAPTTHGTSIGGIRSGPKAWSSTLAPMYPRGCVASLKMQLLFPPLPTRQGKSLY
jgi:ferredoxin